MRFDAYNQVSMIYQTQAKAKVKSTASVSASDKLEISQFGKDLQIAKAAVKNASDVREDRVAQVKAKYEAGEYDISNDELAAKLAEKYQTTLF